EDQKTHLRHIRGSGCRRVRDRFGCAERSSQEEESGSRTATTAGNAAADMLGSSLCAGMRDQGRHEVHLHKRLLRNERTGGGCYSRRMQGRGEGRQKEEKGVSRIRRNLRTGPLPCGGPLHFT